jgi:hypothetical protein
MDDRIKKIAEHYGLEAQIEQLLEEMEKLEQTVNELWLLEAVNIGGSRRALASQLAKEIAGTEIMLDQIKHLLKIEGGVDDWKEHKLERTLEKIEPEKTVKVIIGTHEISLNPTAKEYVWRIPDDLTVKVGDIVRVNTKRGQDNALVLEVREIPISEAKKHKEVIGEVNLAAWS